MQYLHLKYIQYSNIIPESYLQPLTPTRESPLSHIFLQSTTKIIVVFSNIYYIANQSKTNKHYGNTRNSRRDGFLTDPSIWNEDVAKLFAEADGITELNDKHWAIIKIIRDNFEEKGNAPMVRTICKETGLKLKDIYELFPLGPARGACRVAGLPKPDGCV